MTPDISVIIVGKANGKIRYIEKWMGEFKWTKHLCIAKMFKLEDARSVLRSNYFQEQTIHEESGQFLSPNAILDLIFNSDPNQNETQYEIYLAKVELQQCIDHFSGNATTPEMFIKKPTWPYLTYQS